MSISAKVVDSWSLRLLGDFALLRGGEVVKRFGSRREDELLAFLALDIQIPKHREKIAASIWPGVDRLQGLRHVSYNLFMLRRELESVGLPDAIQTIGRSALLLDERIEVDAQVFNETVSAALSSTQEPDALEQALEAYGGPLLPTCNARWLSEPRQHYERLYEAARVEAGELVVVPAQGSVRALEGASGNRDEGGRFPGVLVELPSRSADEALVELARDAEVGLAGDQASQWIERIRSVYPRIEAMLARSASGIAPERGLALASRLWRYWYLTSQFSTGADWLQRLLREEKLASRADLARAYHAFGTLMTVDGHADTAIAHLERALSMWQELDATTPLLQTLVSLGMAHQHCHNTQQAAELYDQCIAIGRALTNEPLLEVALHNRATLAQAMEDYDLALNLHDERLSTLPMDAPSTKRAAALVGMACAEEGRHNHGAAAKWASEALKLLVAADQPRLRALCHQVLGGAALQKGDLETAAREYAAALEAARQTRQLRHVGTSMAYLALTMRRQGDREAARRTFQDAIRLIEAAGSVGEAERFRTEWEATPEGGSAEPPS